MRPAELRRLDALLASAMIAHEAIFDMSRVLREQGSIDVEVEGLLGESARIVTMELPDVTSTVHRLADQWSEQSLLEPSAAATTMREIEREMERVRPDIEQRLVRQRQIAGRLRDLLEG
jgi:hypothetical protein